MKQITLNKSSISLPESWEELSFKQKLFAFGVLIRVMTGDLRAHPHKGLLYLLISFTRYRPSKTYLSKFLALCRLYQRLAWVCLRNIPFLFRHGRKEYLSYLQLWKKNNLPDQDAEAKQREIINFNLLRLAEQLKFIYTIDAENHKILPQYDFRTNPFPYIKIGKRKYWGKRFELDITAKTDITAREFVDCADLMAAMNKLGTDEEKQECINQICAILYPRSMDYTKNMVSGHNKTMRKVNPVVKFGIVYWFTSVFKFYTEHEIYSLLFKGDKKPENEEKVRLGNEVILMLQREGYGLPDTMNLNDYFDAQIKHLKDVINKALGEGIKPFDIARKTGISIDVINKLS
ncbi:hypothetical protein [Proteiniphilum sp.]|uniref:hypothetical protein n=1 Tax=Proteiniphilum sp. TaxID=1926877 RepID=UPI002B1EB044|nr:hypothetical protein [Proteiniphilum sp.]MEA4918149.1 hypothetical protein [Proteiniphilum sp.]